MSIENAERLLGRLIASMAIAQTALAFIVDKGLASAREVEEMLDTAVLGFETGMSKPGIAVGNQLRFAAETLSSFAANLGRIEAEGKALRDAEARRAPNAAADAP